MKNILAITQNFTGGGVESQLINQAKYFSKQGINIHLATSSSGDTIPPNIFASQLTNIKLDGSASAAELMQSIDNIISFVNDKNIEVINAHPFLSALIAMPVAELTNLPLTYTIHGPTSLYFPKPNSISSLLLHLGLLNNCNAIICISKEMRLLTQCFTNNSIMLSPNSVELGIKYTHKPENNNNFMWAGRIDMEKSQGLIQLLDFIIEREGLNLNIYGDGPYRNELEKKYDNPRIVFSGWYNSLSDVIDNYNIVCGMGRVALEAAAVNRSVVLIGYNGIKGFLTKDLAQKAEFWNLSGRGMQNISNQALNQQHQNYINNPEEYFLYDWIKENRSNDSVYNSYINNLKKLNPFKSKLGLAFYDTLHYLGDSKEPYWASNEAYNILLSIARHNYRYV